MKQIIGIHSGCDCQYNWNVAEELSPKIGDFAIVENYDSFTLVEIVGITEIRDDYAQYRKNVVGLISRKKLTDCPIYPNEDLPFE